MSVSRSFAGSVFTTALVLLLATSSALAIPYKCQEFIDGEWRDCTGGVEEELPPLWFEPTQDLVMWVRCDPPNCGARDTDPGLSPPGPQHVLRHCGRFGLGLSDVSMHPQQYKFAAGLIVQLDPGLGSIASVEWTIPAHDRAVIGAPPIYRWIGFGGPYFGSSTTSVYQSNRKPFPVRYPGTYIAKVGMLSVVTSRLQLCFPADSFDARAWQVIDIAP